MKVITEIDKVVPIACCLFNESDLIDINTLNPVQPIERRVTRAYAKKMGISVPETYPNKSQTNQATSPNTQTTQPTQVPNPPEKVNTRPQQSSNQTLRQDTPPHPGSFTKYSACTFFPMTMTSHHPLRLDTRHVPHMTSVNLDLLTDKTSIAHDSGHQHREVPPELYHSTQTTDHESKQHYSWTHIPRQT